MLQPKKNNANKLYLAGLVFLIGFVLFQSNSATAEANIQYGRIEIHPGLSFGVQYNDNIFREADKTFVNNTSEGRSGDFIIVTSPSISFRKNRENGELFGFDLGYIGTDEHFMDLGDQNFFENDVFGEVNFGGPGGRSQMILGGEFLSTAENPKDINQNEFTTNFPARVERTIFKGFADFEWKFNHLFVTGLHADFRRKDYDLESLSNEERDTWNIGADFFRVWTSRTSLGIKYNLRLIDYHEVSTKNFDSHENSFLAAVQWKATALIVGEIALGFSDRNFDDIGGKDRSDFIFDMELHYRPTKRTDVRLSGVRTVDDSSFRDLQTVLRHSAELRITQKFLKKFKAEIDIEWDNLDYETAVADTKGGGAIKIREDNRISSSISLIYNIQKWLQAEAKYSYVENFSNFDDKDYTNNFTLFSFSVIY